jgi:arginase family enzyme
MCLSASVGHWDAGFEPALDASRVLSCGVRQVDPGEPVPAAARPSEVPERLRGRQVYVHLDLDVLDPGVLPAQFAEPHGLSDTGLRTLLADVARESEVVGLEVTAFEHPTPENVELVASIVRTLLP